MHSILKILFDVLVIVVIAATAVYLYRVYGDDMMAFFGQQDDIVVFIDNLAVSVTIADDLAELRQGLSGVSGLGELEGKLLIFEEEGYHKIWMKDMLFPIDIIFVNNDFRVVDVAENVLPETYPLTYTSSAPARFVLEMNAHSVQTFNIEEGDELLVPPRYLPSDLRERLRE